MVDINKDIKYIKNDDIKTFVCSFLIYLTFLLIFIIYWSKHKKYVLIQFELLLITLLKSFILLFKNCFKLKISIFDDELCEISNLTKIKYNIMVQYNK